MSALSRLFSIHGVLRPTCPTEEGAPEPSEAMSPDLPMSSVVADTADTFFGQNDTGDSTGPGEVEVA